MGHPPPISKERRRLITCLAGALVPFPFFGGWRKAAARGRAPLKEEIMELPRPEVKEGFSVAQAIARRRTTRSFGLNALTLNQVAQLLWAAQGITGDRGHKRSSPSAGALYPMDIYLTTGPGCVEGVDPGVYHYDARPHRLKQISGKDQRESAAQAALSQMWMAKAPVTLVITAEYSRICGKYGERGVRYAMIEAGHIAQNIFLQAEALGLKAGIVGAFRDRDLSQALNLPQAHAPLLAMPAGHPRDRREKAV